MEALSRLDGQRRAPVFAGLPPIARRKLPLRTFPRPRRRDDFDDDPPPCALGARPHVPDPEPQIEHLFPQAA